MTRGTKNRRAQYFGVREVRGSREPYSEQAYGWNDELLYPEGSQIQAAAAGETEAAVDVGKQMEENGEMSYVYV